MAELEYLSEHLNALLLSVSDTERRKLAMSIARKIRKSQKERIARNKNPDGSAYVARKKLKKPSKPISFIYQKPNGEKRLVVMKQYRPSKTRYFGFDLQAGGIRTFLRSRVVKYLPTTGTGEELKTKKGKIKQLMFNQLKNNKYLKIEKLSNGISIGFSERVSRIANVHQFGLIDQVERGTPITAKYAKRELLGFTDKEIELIEKEILEYIDKK